MAKIKKTTTPDTCPEAIFPLGKGVPMCMFDICREHRTKDVKLQDIPFCRHPKHCYKEEYKKKKQQEEQTAR